MLHILLSAQRFLPHLLLLLVLDIDGVDVRSQSAFSVAHEKLRFVVDEVRAVDNHISVVLRMPHIVNIQQ